MIFFISKKRFTQISIAFLFMLVASGCMLQIERYLHGVKKDVLLEEYNLSYFLRSEVEDVVTQLALERNAFPQNAGLNKSTGAVVAAVYGKKIKIAETVKAVMQAQPQTKINLIYEVIPPAFNEEFFVNQPQISSYVTWFYGRDGRYQNIKLALKEINNTVLYPDEIFSFNRIVGPRTPKRGFQKAPSIGVPEDYGGGVCQVASTLFNAVTKGDFTILERHKHSKPVKYVASGKDATVSYNFYDFKFQNNKPYPIVITTSFKNYGIRVNVFGGEVK